MAANAIIGTIELIKFRGKILAILAIPAILAILP